MYSLPFLTAFDPGSSVEGNLDPLGLYMIADQLATRLVPSVRERMQRIRFLTPIAVGSWLTEGLESPQKHPSVTPYMVWEWLVVEALFRVDEEDADLGRVPGSLVVKRALEARNYIDEASYLKNASIFGFHGVYKALANHIGVVDKGMRPGTEVGRCIVEEWAKDTKNGGFNEKHSLFKKWHLAIRNSLAQDPPRTFTNWRSEDWRVLASCFLPGTAGKREKSILKASLHLEGQRSLGALPSIWRMIEEKPSMREIGIERKFHNELKMYDQNHVDLLEAIGAYERFARNIVDIFDIILARGGTQDMQGLHLGDLAAEDDIRERISLTPDLWFKAKLKISTVDSGMESRFTDRFLALGEQKPVETFLRDLCLHHESIQKAKARGGKRSWFDRLDKDRIYIRQSYRREMPENEPTDYVHAYRMAPIQSFYRDLG
jgi:hypothetical protein